MGVLTIQSLIMNPYIQVAIPMLLAAIVLGIIMVKRKYLHVKSILTVSAAVGLTVICAVIGLKQKPDVKHFTQGVEQYENNTYLANELLLSGNYDYAIQMMNELHQEQGVNAESLVQQARVMILNGNVSAAQALYAKAKTVYEDKGLTDFVQNEYDAVNQYIQNQKNVTSDAAVIAYLKEQNIDPKQYGLEETKAAGLAGVTLEQIEELIHENIEDKLKELKKNGANEQSIDRLAEYVTEVETIYSQFVNTGSFDTESIGKLKRKLDKYFEENPDMANNRYLRLARLKAMVLHGDYKDIANAADEYSTAEELMIISELYMNGEIKESSFSENFSTVDDEKLQTVLAQCNEVYNNGPIKDESKLVRNTYKSNIKLLEKSLDKKNLITTMNYLQKGIDTVDVSLQSKTYLQLAKVAQYLKMDAKAGEYITLSMNTVGDALDMDYAKPMYELVGIINGNGDSDSVKSIAAYVNQVIEHSLPIRMIRGEDTSSVGNSKKYANEDNSLTESRDPEALQLMSSASSKGVSYKTEDKDKNSDKAEEKAEDVTFNQFFTNTVSEKTATINIGTIDKTSFPEVKAKIQVTSDHIKSVDDFKRLITLTDCKRKVDYKVEKQKYEKSRIILLVDVSGSMDGSIDYLKYAVRSFANNMNSDEEICVVAFSSGIEFDTGFTTVSDDITAAAERLYANGGTALYESLLQVGTRFSSDVNYNNIIICMTDGEDNEPASASDIYSEVSKMCAQSSCTVYTLGLGQSVDTTYLTNIANAGQGSFLYIADAASLDNFFSFVHKQTTNQYVVTYTAKDTTTNKRILRAELSEDHSNKEKVYYLVEPSNYDDEDAIGDDVFTQGDYGISGLTAKTVYKSKSDIYDDLKGQGFKKDVDIQVSLEGLINYDLGVEFVDDTTYKVKIPSGIAPGTYNLKVVIDDEVFLLEDELSVIVPGTEKSIKFGDYQFTCLNSTVDNDGNRVLSGEVLMNGWLHFRGEVTLSGDIENSDRLTVTDHNGSYISYSKQKSKNGLAKFMADQGVSIPLASFGQFDIFKEEYEPDSFRDFKVDDILEVNTAKLDLVLLEDLNLNLYPDMVYIKNCDTTFNFPFQKKLLGDSFADDLKSTKTDRGIMLTATTVGFTDKIEYEIPENKEARISILPVTLKAAEVEFNTFQNDYSIAAEVAFKQLPKMEAVKFKFDVKDGRFDGFDIKTELTTGIPIQEVPVPMSINDMGIGISGLSNDTDHGFDYILSLPVTGHFDLNVADVEAVLPAVAEFLEYTDVDTPPCVIQFDDCSITATVKDLALDFTADMKFLGMYKFGQVEVNLGKFSYSDELLNIRSIDEYGFRAKVTLKNGDGWKTDNFELNLLGSLETTIGYPVMGIHGRVEGDFTVKVLCFKKEFAVDADLYIGFRKNAYDNLQFDAILRAGSKGKYIGFRVCVTPESGFSVKGY